MDTNLLKVVSKPLDQAEVTMRSMNAQGYMMTHMTAVQASGVLSTITVVMVFERSKEAVVNSMENATARPLAVSASDVKKQGKR